MKNLRKTLCALALALTGCGEKEKIQQQPTKKPTLQYLTVETKENLTYRLPLECLEDRVNIFITPTKKPRLHFYEEEIAPQEYFVATDESGNTRIIEYSALQSNEIWFWDMSSFETTRVYPADNILTLGDSPRTFYVLPNGNIRVDLNGDGEINELQQSPIVYKDGRELNEEDLRTNK